MKNSRKFAVFLVLTFMLSLLTPMLSHLTGTNELVQAATFKISKKNATMYLGDSLQLKVSGLKTGDKVTWSSSNKEVASVSSKGVVTAKTPNASAKITATVKYKYTYKYKVKKKYKYKTKTKTKKLYCTINTIYPPLDRKLNVTEQLLGSGYSFELSVVDADPYDTITYSVRDPYIAYVDDTTYKGKVSARSFGSTEVYADVVSKDGTQSCRLVCKVEVIPQSQARGLNYYAKDVEQFKDFTLQVTNASNVDFIEYESSNPNVASVTNTGTSHTTVTGRGIGTTYITARIKKTGNVVEEKSCRVIVKEYDKNRSISLSMPTLTKGSTTQVTIGNLNPLLDTVTYESVDKKVATVDNSGIVKAVAAGTTTIKANITFPTGEVTTLYTTITVTDPPKTTTK